MSDLVNFIRARLAEDEQDASEDHTLGCSVRDWYAATAEDGADMFDVDRCSCPVRRRLLTVAALRAVLAEHEVRTHVTTHLFGDPGEYTRTWWACTTCNLEEGCPTLRAVASIWRDHPDFRPEWT